MRVVDEDGERLPFVDALESTRNRLDGGDATGDRVLVEVEEQPGGHGAEHVLDVEGAAQSGLDLDPRRPEPAPVGRDLETLWTHVRRLVEPEGDEWRAMQVAEVVCEPATPLVADVTAAGGGCARTKSARLAVEVLLHRPVQIEVVVAEVREHQRVEANAVQSPERRSV